MTNTQKSYIRQEKQTKDQLRTMLIEALRNADHIEMVHVPLNKRALPTRQKPAAEPATDEPMAEIPDKEPTKGQKKRA
jgi:hypothetical protein